jgi:oligoendopeptidase F
MEAKMRGDKAHLRTRFTAKGLNYQGFNTLAHELGHCTEQVISLNLMDHNLLRGVPNTAFTEAFAFVYQARDLDLLGITVKPDPKSESLLNLHNLWLTNEICGVGLLDMRIWHWMYEHPDATPAELKAAVIDLAKGIWNQYYAPVFGVKDSPILAIYSHIIELGMYTPDYGLGHIVQFQLEQYFKTAKLAAEMERICRQGMITPDAWIKGAVGKGISTEPLLKAAAAALKVIK